MSICKKAVSNIDAIRTFYHTNPDSEFAEIGSKLQGLALAITKSNGSFLRTSLRDFENIREGVTDVNGIIKALTSAKGFEGIDSWQKLKETGDKPLLHYLNLRIDGIMETMIYAGKKPADYAENHGFEKAFHRRFKSLYNADVAERGMMSAASLDFARKFMGAEYAKEWDGFVVQKDKLFKRNRYLDEKRSRYRRVTNDVETQAGELFSKITTMFQGRGSKIIDTDQASQLLKFYDEDIIKASMKQFGDERGLLKKEMSDKYGISKPEDIEKAVDYMDRLYDTWQEINYGQKGNIDMSTYNAADHPGTMLNYIHNIGKNIVDQIDKSDISRNSLDKAQRYFIEKFGTEEQTEKWGVQSTPLQPRQRYVPVGKNDEIAQVLEHIGELKMFSNLDMFGSRKKRAEANDSDFKEVVVADIELLRRVASDVSQFTLAQDIRAHMNGKLYQDWKDSRNNSMEHGMFGRYADYVIDKFKDRKNPSRKNASKVFQTVKQASMLLLGLQGTQGLAFSAHNNLVQGALGAFNIMSFTQVKDLIGNVNKAKEGPDKTLAKLATISENLLKDKTKGRKAEFVLKDADLDVQSKLMQAGFKLADSAISYGYAQPVIPFLRMFGMNTEGLKNRWFSMGGSERILRNFKTNIFFNMVQSKYEAMKVAGTPLKAADAESFVKELREDSNFKLDRWDIDLFGDFSKDSKPFWSYGINKAEGYRDLMLGFAGAQFYMFRQAGMFGLLGTTTNGLIRNLSDLEGISKSSAVSTIAPSIIMLDFLWEYTSNMILENPPRISMINAVNQLDPFVGAVEGIHAMIAPMFNINVSQKQYDKIYERFTRFGAGMLAGNSMSNDDDRLTAEWSPTAMVAKAAKNSIEPFKLMYDMMTTGIDHTNMKAFKKRIRERGTGVNMLDQIVGPGNDALRQMLKGLYTANVGLQSLKGDVGNRAQQKLSVERNRAFINMILSPVGLHPYTEFDSTNLRIGNGINLFTKNNSLEDMKNKYSSAEEAIGSIEGRAYKYLDETDGPMNNFME